MKRVTGFVALVALAISLVGLVWVRNRWESFAYATYALQVVIVMVAGWIVWKLTHARKGHVEMKQTTVPPRLMGAVACVLIYGAARGVQLLGSAIENGLSLQLTAEVGMAVALCVALLMRNPAWTVGVVAAGLALAAAGWLEADLWAVAVLILISGFHQGWVPWTAGALGVSYLLGVALFTDGAPFVDATFLSAAGIAAAAVAAMLGRFAAEAKAREAQVSREAAERVAESANARLAVAAEIHDSIGHYLSSIQALASGALAQDSIEVSQEALRRIYGSSSQAQGRARDLVEHLADPNQTLGARRIRDLAESVSAAMPVGVQSSVSIVGVIPKGMENLLCKVVLEAATNALKYSSGMTRLDVTLAPTLHGVTATIINNGEPVEVAERVGGLARLREEMEATGGALIAGPLPGGGWVVEAELN